MVSFLFPNWRRLVADASVQQHIVGKVIHRQLRGNEPARRAVSQYRNVRIAVGTMGLARSTALESGPCYVVAIRHSLHEGVSRG